MTDLVPVDDGLLIATPHVRIVDQGVVFTGRMSLEEYGIWTHQILYVWNSMPFFVGDTLLYGEQFIGEDYSQFFEAHYSSQTIANYMSVCRRVPLENRRIHELSFGHHEAVAVLPPNEQREWLQAALDNGWRRDELRAAIKGTSLEVLEEEESPFAPMAPKELPPCGNDRDLEAILLDAFEANSRGDTILVAKLLDKAIQRVRKQ